MEVKKTRSHKGGLEFLREHRPQELRDIYDAVAACDAVHCLQKQSKESTKPALLLSPVTLNEQIKSFLHPRGWTEPAPGTAKGFREPRISVGGGTGFREMDGIKNKVGLEVQFGKYAFMGYDLFSKMPIFASRGLIDCGIEVVAMPEVVREMSTGVSSFDQINDDMDNRGEADLDLPSLVIGVGLTEAEWRGVLDKRGRFASNPEALIKGGEVSGGRRGARPGPK